MRVLDDPEEVYRAAAEEVAARIVAAVGALGSCAIALSGGSTPRGLYLRLAEDGGARVPWDRVDVFWGDQRHVPPDHPESNYRMAAEALLRRVAIPPARVHRIRAENPDAEAVGRAYEEEIRVSFTAPGRIDGRWPRFDLCLLGIGLDGHTASLLPGSDALHEVSRLVAAPWLPALAAHPFTLTPPVLNAAEAVIFVVTGAEKAAALASVLEGERRLDRHPSQLIRPVGGELLWLVDGAAADELKP